LEESILTTSHPECICTEPKNRHKSGHIDRIIKEHVILVKICLYKIKHKKLMENYNLFQFFWLIINLSQQFYVLEVIFATKLPGLGLIKTLDLDHI
jgi:hypothetical protein